MGISRSFRRRRAHKTGPALPRGLDPAILDLYADHAPGDVWFIEKNGVTTARLKVGNGDDAMIVSFEPDLWERMTQADRETLRAAGRADDAGAVQAVLDRVTNAGEDAPA